MVELKYYVNSEDAKYHQYDGTDDNNNNDDDDDIYIEHLCSLKSVSQSSAILNSS
jgi:hypothetical protein